MFSVIHSNEIVIGFSTAIHTNTPIAPMIRRFEGTEFSHVYIRYWSEGLQRHLILQSNIDNVNFTNEEHFFKHNKIIDEFAFHVDPSVKVAVLQKAIDRLHIPYGKLQLVGMGVAQLWKRWTGKWISNPFKDGEKSQVCSELAGHVLIEAGYWLPVDKLEVMGPKWLYERVNEWLAQDLCRKVT